MKAWREHYRYVDPLEQTALVREGACAMLSSWSVASADASVSPKQCASLIPWPLQPFFLLGAALAGCAACYICRASATFSV
eukprot:scaffold221570_cov17-Tisochrysis_lutea.AAC.1